MKVKILGGTYGWRDECGRVTRMHAGDECEVSETEGARLCSLGMAEPADGRPVKSVPETAKEKQPEEAEDNGGEGDELPDRAVLAKMTVAQLRKLCVAEGMGEAEAKRAAKADCLDYLAPIPDMNGTDAGDIIV
jgi:hypothetical protein